MAATLLFRGLPATGGVADYRTRQVLDGIIENLRGSGLSVSASGAVFSGAEPVAYRSSLTQLGGGAMLGVDFVNSALRLKTIAVAAPLTMTQTGTLLTLGLNQAAQVADAFTVIAYPGDNVATAGALSVKLTNADIGGIKLLRPGSGRLELKTVLKGDGILVEDTSTDTGLSIRVSTNLVAKEGSGITLEVNETTKQITIDSDAADHKVCIGPDPVTYTDDVPGYLSDKLVNHAVDGAIPTLGVDTTSWVMGTRGLVGSDGISIAPATPVEDDPTFLSNIDFKFRPGTIAGGTFDAATYFVVGFDSEDDDELPKTFLLGDAAGRNKGTGTEDLAAGDHTHASVLPAGSEGDVLYYSTVGGVAAWRAANLADLVCSAIYDLSARSPILETDEVLTRRSSDDSMAWGPVKKCT